MFIKIDNRESDLLLTMNLLFKEHSHDICVEKLNLGDIILYKNSEPLEFSIDDMNSSTIFNSDKIDRVEQIIFERKSLYDLASSIKDGRYNEQSYRLNNYKVHNHNIVYIIEGDFERYNATKGRMDKKTLYSALITLNYFKGFSVIRTKNINETCELIINYADKLQKEPKKPGYYDENKKDNDVTYSQVMKAQKKNNITQENIGEIMLSNIPGVSSKSAIVIMKKLKTMKNLIHCLQEDDTCLDDIKITIENGQTRKISKTCIENIKKFVLV